MPQGGRLPSDRKPRPPAGPGKLANRSDLSQPNIAAPGQPYGERKLTEGAQQAVPLPNRRGPSAPSATRRPTPGPSGAAPTSPSAPLPPLAELLMRPTAHPGEPLTAGLSAGPGGGENIAGPGLEDNARMAELLRQATDPQLPPNLRTVAHMWNLVLQARRSRPVTEVPLTEDDMLQDTFADLDGSPLGLMGEEAII